MRFFSLNHGKILHIPWFGECNSQHVYRDFIIALDQSDSVTQLCHARIIFLF